MSKACEGCNNADLRDSRCCRICDRYEAKIISEFVARVKLEAESVCTAEGLLQKIEQLQNQI